jgi:hypothetical protein
MGQPYSSETEHFDMLPFIGLLMCVLGVLLFVTLSVAALAMGPNVKEGWLPIRAQDRKKMPILLEWDGTNAVIHRGKQTSSILVYAQGGLSRTSEFSSFIDEMVSKRKSEYVLFAVRPSGFKNFQSIADEFRNRRVDIGYEPIAQEKAVRLLTTTSE